MMQDQPDRFGEEFFLQTFSLHLNPEQTDLTIHEAVQQAIGDLWNEPCYQKIYTAILQHLHNSKEVSKIKTTCLVDDDMLGSLVYYTSDTRLFGGSVNQCIFKLLNSDLLSRDPSHLKKWEPFLYHALQAQKYLPKYQGISYRGINKPISSLSSFSQYETNSTFTWITFTSSTTNSKIIEKFSSRESGTWMIISGNQGIRLPFSLFSQEEEVLFFPNTIVKVTNVLTPTMKSVLGHSDHLDVIELEEKSEMPMPTITRKPKTKQSRIDPFKVEPKRRENLVVGEQGSVCLKSLPLIIGIIVVLFFGLQILAPFSNQTSYSNYSYSNHSSWR